MHDVVTYSNIQMVLFYGFRMRIYLKSQLLHYYKVAKNTIHKPSLDHNMIVTKVGVTLGPSTQKIDMQPSQFANVTAPASPQTF